MRNGLQKILGSGLFDAIEFVDNPQQVLRAVLVSGVLIVLNFVMLFFFLFHLFYTLNQALMVVSLVAVSILTGVLYYLRTHQNVYRAGHYATIAIVVFFPVYVHLNQNNQFGLIWLFFVPFLITSFVGWRLGLRYIGLFLIVILAMAYANIGVWEQGRWAELSFIRLTIGLLLGTILAMVIDMSSDELNKRIQKQRKKEIGYLEDLKKLSTTDGLTELYNRHYFNEVLEKKLEELQDSNLYLTFFILDIDHFKLYNDYFGHQKGDEALKRVAQAVHNYIKRRDDLVFRLGGEEFGGLIITDNPQETSVWIAGLTGEVKSLHIAHAKEVREPYLTISIGIYSSQIKDMEAIRHLYKTADDALYQAKENGRDQARMIVP